MVGAVTQLGDLSGVLVADEVTEGAPPPALIGLEEVVHPRTEDAGGLEAEVVGEPGDKVGEESVEQEEDDEGPFQDRVCQYHRHPVAVPVQYSREFVGRHGIYIWIDEIG